MIYQCNTDKTPILSTRIPEYRVLDGVEYGAHCSGPGWSGYYVRPLGGQHWAVAKMTPCDDELAGDDSFIKETIAAEIDILMGGSNGCND